MSYALSRQDPEKIAWVFNAIRDQIDRKLMQPKDLTERQLMGSKGGRGLIDLFLLKRDLLKYLTTTWLDELKMPSDMKAKAPEVLASHKSYAQHMSPIEGAQPVQMTWRRTWSQSSILAMALIEDLVYGDGNDTALRSATKSGKGPRDIMAFESMVAKVADIQQMRKNELDEIEKANLPANSVSESAPGSVPPESAPVDDAIGKEALRILDSQISLIVEPQDGIELKQAIMNSCFKNAFGNETTGCAQLKKKTDDFRCALRLSVALCATLRLRALLRQVHPHHLRREAGLRIAEQTRQPHPTAQGGAVQEVLVGLPRCPATTCRVR